MERRDYVQEQIEAIGRVLGYLIAKLLGLKGKMPTAEFVIKQLNEELDLDLNEFKSMDPKQITEKLKRRSFTDKHLDQMAEICIQLGKQNVDDRQDYLKLAYSLLFHTHEHSPVYSLDREEKLEEVRKLIILKK